MRARSVSERRCPWCQHLIPQKLDAMHRCPAKPQSYPFDEAPRARRAARVRR